MRAPVRRTAAATSWGCSPPRSRPTAARARPSCAESRSSSSAPSPSSSRNSGIAATGADWLFFVDDDVEVRPGWLAALLTAARDAPDDVAVLAGAIHARIENPRYRQCGREGPPITFLESDRGVGWGA